MTLPQDNAIYGLLDKVKDKNHISVRCLNPEEIVLAEELVQLKLLTKFSTANNTVYTYGGIPNDEETERSLKNR